MRLYFWGAPLSLSRKAAAEYEKVFMDPDPVAASQVNMLRYLRKPFRREPGLGVTSVNYSFEEFIQSQGRRAESSPVSSILILLTRRVNNITFA